MNGRNPQPPDKSKTNDIPRQNDESIFNRIELKQEPDIKLNPEDVDDMVKVSASERAASGSVVNLVGGEQTGDTYNFTDVCDFTEVKSDVKKEKIDKKVEKGSAECSGGRAIRTPNDAKDYRSNKKQSKPKPASIGSKKTEKSAATARNKPKMSSFINKKKSEASKRKGKQHKCLSCNYTTSRKNHLNRHQRKHTGEKPFPCIYCARRFTRKDNVQLHMRLHVSEFLYSCSNCLKGFFQSDEKLKHEINCKIRSFECHICKEYSTFKKLHLEYHMRMHHTGNKPFRCDQCTKKFVEQSKLKRHMKTHINHRPLKFKCSVCYRNFSQRNEKDEHEAKCKCRGYECYLCKEFNSNFPSNLKKHMRTHIGLKPFQCEVCQKSFKQKQHLQRHVFR